MEEDFNEALMLLVEIRNEHEDFTTDDDWFNEWLDRVAVYLKAMSL